MPEAVDKLHRVPPLNRRRQCVGDFQQDKLGRHKRSVSLTQRLHHLPCVGMESVVFIKQGKPRSSIHENLFHWLMLSWLYRTSNGHAGEQGL